jgi:hypothetical protein
LTGAGGGKTPWALIVAVICLALGATDLRAQLFDVSAYYFNLASGSGDSPLVDAGASDFQRLRLMWAPDVGPLALDVAYEHTLFLNTTDVPATATGILVPEAGGNWMTLDWTVDEGDHLTWRHRFDRLGLTVPLGASTELSVGRQVVSWASTLILTPADPFTPFDPADPFREYRAGVDAVRFRAYPGPFSEIDLVVRPISRAGDDQITALARGKTNWRGWDVAVWGGVVFDEPAGALSLVGAFGPWAVRSEVAVRSEADDVIVRGTLGVDRRFSVGGRDLYLIAEYQHDGFGAAGSDDLFGVLASDPFQRGELQVLGRDALAVQGSYQIRPLWGVDLLTVTSLADGSGLVSGGVGWSVGANSSLRGGFFLGFGDDTLDPVTGIGSEFGARPPVGYVSLSHFF